MVSSEPGSPLLGASVPSDRDLFFVSDDPAWKVNDFRVTDVNAGWYWPVARHQLLISGRGDLVGRPVIRVTVGPGGSLVTSVSNNSATRGAVVEPVRVGTTDAVGWSAVSSGIPISSIDWPAPNDYQATIVANGLDLDATAALAARIGFDGLDPTLEPSSDYTVFEHPGYARSSSALFAKDASGLQISCSNDGEFGMLAYQMGAFARVTPRIIAGATVAQRADPVIGPPQTLLDGAAWLLGEWWCSVWSSPVTMEGGEVPVIPDDEVEALLASLTLVDEATLRTEASEVLHIDLGGDFPTTTPTTPADAFSAGEVGATGAWNAHFTPDGTRIMATSTGMTSPIDEVQFIDASSGALLRSFPVSGFDVSCGTRPISDDGRYLWDGSTVRDSTTGTSVFSPAISGAGDFSPDGMMIVISGDNRFTVYSTTTGEELTTIAPNDYRAMCGQFTADSRRLFLPGLMPLARMWDLASDSELFQMALGDGLARLSPDGRFIALNDDRPRLLDGDTGVQLLSVKGSIQAFSPDGTRFVEVPRDLSDTGITIWDLRTMQPMSVIQHRYDWQVPLDDASFNADGTRIVLVSEGAAKIYDTATGKVVATLELEAGTVLSAAYSPDGTQIVTANSTGTVGVWPAP